MIRETDLQNVKKLKRGRPSKLPSKLEDGYWNDAGNSATRRTMRNYYFFYEALNLLAESGIKQYKFLYDISKDLKRQGNRHLKKTILSELGRIKDQNVLLEAASIICEAQPKTATAVKWIREIRKESDLKLVKDRKPCRPPKKDCR